MRRLGRGTFGYVQAVRSKSTGSVYAVKCTQYGLETDVNYNNATKAECKVLKFVNHVSFLHIPTQTWLTAP